MENVFPVSAIVAFPASSGNLLSGVLDIDQEIQIQTVLNNSAIMGCNTSNGERWCENDTGRAIFKILNYSRRDRDEIRVSNEQSDG